MILQFGAKNVPAIIFLITGTYRYQQIRHTATGKVIKSKFFLTKVAINILMGLSVLALILADFPQINGSKNGQSIAL
jgi:hypothetical protein